MASGGIVSAPRIPPLGEAVASQLKKSPLLWITQPATEKGEDEKSEAQSAINAWINARSPAWCFNEGALGRFYLITWFTFNVAITLYSKALFGVFKFPYPMLMTAIHMLFTSIGVCMCRVLGLFTPRKASPEMLRTVLWFSVVFTLNIWLSNASLMAVSVNLHQVTRTTIPLFTMVISLLLYGEKYPLRLLPSILLVIVGVSASVQGDLDFTLYGFVVVLIGCFFSSLKGLITQKTQVGALGLSSLELLGYLCPLAIVQLLLLAAFNGEITGVMEDANVTYKVWFHLSTLGWIAFGLNFVSFRCAALLNPLTLNIAGNVKQVVTCLLGFGLFGGVMSMPLLFGIFATAIGAYWYSHDMRKWREEQRALKAAGSMQPTAIELADVEKGEEKTSLRLAAGAKPEEDKDKIAPGRKLN